MKTAVIQTSVMCTLSANLHLSRGQNRYPYDT